MNAAEVSFLCAYLLGKLLSSSGIYSDHSLTSWNSVIFKYYVEATEGLGSYKQR